MVRLCTEKRRKRIEKIHNLLLFGLNPGIAKPKGFGSLTPAALAPGKRPQRVLIRCFGQSVFQKALLDFPEKEITKKPKCHV